MITIDLNKKQALDPNPIAKQQITSTANLNRAGETLMFSIYEQVKETIFNFSLGIARVL